MNSWDPPDSGRGERSEIIHSRQPLFVLLVSHVEASRLVVEIEVVDREHTHPQTDLRTDRIERRIEGFLGDTELGQTHRNNAIGAPDKQCKRGQYGYDLEGAL